MKLYEEFKLYEQLWETAEKGEALIYAKDRLNEPMLTDKVEKDGYKNITFVAGLRDLFSMYAMSNKDTVKIYTDAGGMEEITEVCTNMRPFMKDKLLNTVTLVEACTDKALNEVFTETDFDKVIEQLKSDLVSEIKPTPVVEVGEFYDNTDEAEATFKDIYVSWEQWDETNYIKSKDFDKAYQAVVDWVEINNSKYPGFKLNVLEPVAFYGNYFVTISIFER